jgi:hypothetical protein
MGSSAQVTFAFLAKDVASGTIRGLSKTISGLGSVAGKVGGILKTGLKVGFAALGGVITGAGAALAKFTKDAIEGAAAEAKVVSVLKARGLATKENIAAMEAMVKSGERLAFSGDDIRGSLQTATQFTNNFAKAQKIATVAQDLARSKNISLERATTLVGKAFSGNGKALKNYGINLEKTISTTEKKNKVDEYGNKVTVDVVKKTKEAVKGQKALDAILGSVGGTAKTYATTTQGAIQAAGIAIQQAGERAVAPFIPIINELLDIFFTKGLPIIDAVSGAIAGFIEKNKELISTVIQTAVGIVTNLIPVLVEVGKFIFGTIIPAIVGFVQSLTAPGGLVESVMKVVGPLINDLVPVFQKVVENIVNLGKKVFELIGILWGDGEGPLAAAFKGIVGVGTILFNIFGDIVGVIGTVIGEIIKVGKAIMDSPLGWLIKQVAGFIGGVAGGIGGVLLPKNAGVVPASATSGGGRDSVGGRDVVVRNDISFGRDAYSSINTNIGSSTRFANGSRTNGR